MFRPGQDNFLFLIHSHINFSKTTTITHDEHHLETQSYKEIEESTKNHVGGLLTCKYECAPFCLLADYTVKLVMLTGVIFNVFLKMS